MKTFKLWLEEKNKKQKIHLAQDIEGEPTIVATKSKKGKLKMTFNDEGEPVTIK